MSCIQKTDLTQYGDGELSQWVMNDEYFYNERHNIEYLIALLDEQFFYTPEQLEELKTDLEEE